MKVRCILYSSLAVLFMVGRVIGKPKTMLDKSVTEYLAEKVCWWNEICKDEFKSMFNCRCPQWHYCRSPGKYYNAYCSMMDSGYVWIQPTNVTRLAQRLNNTDNNNNSFQLSV